ncbi:DUF421 domain-containing protein [Candidatus Gottesmanbacteria bacterium]|nr:DUF421 domain-containing protein [Candidatus Gottesmanbacteria bacterium]
MIDSVFAITMRSIVVYLFIVLAIRLFGKKELAQLSVVDLVFILLISNSVQNAMVGDNSTLLGGLVAATSLFAVNQLLKILFYRSRTFSRLIQGVPLLLIYHGTIVKEHVEQAKITREELEAAVREHGVEAVGEVDLAVLEVDGNISVLSHNFRRQTLRKRRAHKIISKSY